MAIALNVYSLPILFLAAFLVSTCLGVRSSVTRKENARKLLQNPDLPHQRSSNPSWMNPGSSQSQPSQTQTTSTSVQSDLNSMLMSIQGSNGNSNSDAASSPVVLFAGGQFGAGWHDSSYGARPFEAFSPSGKDTGFANCHFLPKGGATSLYGPAGAFSGRKALQLWAFAGSSSVPDVEIVLSTGNSQECRRVPLSSVSVSETSNRWNKYWIPLGNFNLDQQNNDAFYSCGSNGPSANDVVKVDLYNPVPDFIAMLCVDEVQLI